MYRPLSEIRKKSQITPHSGVFLSQKNAGWINRVNFDFSSKELDEETGFYYYGARYLNPKTSVWISADPAVGDYIPSAPVNEEAKKRNGNLPGMGGVYNYVNFHVYHYAGNNPVNVTDPDGRSDSLDVFGELPVAKQIQYFMYKIMMGNAVEGVARGNIAKELRGMVGSMDLEGLFALEGGEEFMNETLREFLNLNANGTQDYSMADMTEENGWREYSSLTSQYHQTDVPGDKLNAKFVNDDGREAVFTYKKELVTDYPNKGTVNYVDGWSSYGGHQKYDVEPYERLMDSKGIVRNNRFHPIFWQGNSKLW
jgi:RHS repeat-associated protein